MVRSWLAKKLVTRNMEALNRGNIRPTLRMDARDVHFRFPGTSSWAIDTIGRDQVETWLQRLVAIGLQHRPEEVVVSGPPWRMTIVLRGTDHVAEADGTLVYQNRYVIWAATSWGLIRDYEVYEDTEKVMNFDAYVAGGGKGAASAAAATR